MGRPPKDPNKITVEKSALDDILARLNAAEAKSAELEAKVAKGGKQGIETTAQRLLNKPMEREQDPMEVQERIEVVDEPPIKGGKYLKNACPFCKLKHPTKPTIQDLNEMSNKYSCRRCGKHWEKWALETSPFSGKLYPYSEALEQGDRKRVERIERIAMARAGEAVSVIDNDDQD